jgi:hypothetical protein
MNVHSTVKRISFADGQGHHDDTSMRGRGRQGEGSFESAKNYKTKPNNRGNSNSFDFQVVELHERTHRKPSHTDFRAGRCLLPATTEYINEPKKSLKIKDFHFCSPRFAQGAARARHAPRIAETKPKRAGIY